MNMRNVLLAISVFSLSTLAFADRPGQGRGPGHKAAKVQKWSHGGNGCPQNSVGTYISDDGQVFTLSFDQFAVKQGPTVAKEEGRKFCNITVDLQIPDNWQYTIGQVEYRGYANLDAKVKGEIRAEYRYPGAGGSARPMRAEFTGPVITDYLKSDVLETQSRGWSRCGKENKGLEIRTEIQVSGDSKATGLLTVDTVDGSFKQIYGIQWRPCAGK
jgi:hypothetical protein